MFESIIELIKNDEYEIAEKSLQVYIKSDDRKNQSSAYYLIGYINTRPQNIQRSAKKAHRYLLYNMNSEYPNYNAYVLFAQLEEDKNIVEKYLNQGLLKFPDNLKILTELLIRSQDKTTIINRILESEHTDINLLSIVIIELIKSQRWDKIDSIILRITNNNILNEDQIIFFNLLNGFSLIFGKPYNYSKAIKLFESVEEKDLDNRFGYAHYLGLIYSHIKSNSIDTATKYFDKLPMNNTIFDLIDGPYYTTHVDFNKEYKVIFDLLGHEFENDLLRLKKARCLY